MKLKRENKVFWGSAIFFILFAALLFWQFLTGSSVLMSTDAVISAANKTTYEVLGGAFAGWASGVLLGVPSGSSAQIASLLQAVMSGVLWNNLIYGLACLAASFVFFAGLGKRLNPWAVLYGALAAFWLGSNFTLIYAGHGLKPYVVLFFVCSILSARASSWRGGILWGGCVGLMFAQQPDVALFFALFAGAHLIFSLWKRDGFRPVKWLKVLIPAAIVALLFATGPLLSGYKLNVKDTVQVQTETPQEKWEYITQWSFPPDEVISFIAPGYHGWRSGEPDGPYWGRTGQSAGWDQTHQGFMNFMMESVYIGFIPVAFAFFALFSCRRSKHRAEILFWGGASGVALLLAFGKYTPLYSLFYHLPVINNIRNPNKFLQIFQIALAILTAYGFDALFSQKSESLKDERHNPECRSFFWVMVGALGILAICALSVSMNRAEGVSGFMAQGWPVEMAKTIVANQIKALWCASFMAAAVSAVFAFFTFPTFGKFLRFRTGIAAALVLLVAGDALILSKHYVQPMPKSYIQANVLTDFLKKDLGTGRVALLTQQSIYNIWLTYLLPYNQIPTFNFTAMPRMPEDYQAFLNAGSKNPLRMWRFSGVKYLLGPATFEQQLSGQVKKVFAYNLSAAPENEIRVIPDPNGSHAVFELLGTVPRYVLLSGFDVAADGRTLMRLNSAGPLLNGTPTGSVEVVKYRPGRVDLKTQSDVPATLRIAERWDADWKATVDGAPIAVQKIDFLCQGVAVPAGSHRVVLVYSPSKLFLYMQCTGYLALLCVLFFRRPASHEEN
ncbi:MAG: hypothetical protein IT583_03280 [Verrucomicrobia bacterium]|nr:hypothetical protein [Verrucomicrobiota bacterium]